MNEIPVVTCAAQNMCMADLLASMGISVEDFDVDEQEQIRIMLLRQLNKDADETVTVDLKKAKLKIDSADAANLLWLFCR